jgi:hypothetical protein
MLRTAMTIPEFAPPWTAASAVHETLRAQGFMVAEPGFICQLADVPLATLLAVSETWDALPGDPYLKDGGHYRRRRHGSFVVDAERCELVAQRPHFQSPEYNALHGGMQRWFEPLPPALTSAGWWSRLLTGLAGVCSALAPAPRWFVEAHQFRIDTHEGIGRPTPEGAHRDGVDFVALVLIARHAIRGGETRVFSAHGPHGQRFTLSEPWSLMLLDDARVIHESTPIQPLAPEQEASGHRDTLVLTFRRNGFQEPKPAELEDAARR